MSDTSAFWFANPSKGFYPFEVQNSLRFGATSGKLTRTPTSSGNQKKWTSSWWQKKTENGVLQYVWSGGYTAGGAGNDGIAAFYFESDDKIHTYYDTSGSAPYGAVNSKVYRDVTNWYHFVWAVDAANTVHRIWVNGVEETLSSGSQPPNFSYGMNRAGTEQAWGTQSWGGGTHKPMLIAEAVHLDGQYLTADSFGEFKNGLWVPKDIHAQGFTFGTNGYYLNFQDDGGTNGANLGYDVQTADRSGTTNDFSLTNLNEYDQLIDSCTNNFATHNVLEVAHTAESTTSEGNLGTTPSSASTWNTRVSTFNVSSGKWYAEFTRVSDAVGVFVGILQTGSRDTLYIGYGSQGYGYYIENGNVQNSASFVTNGAFGTTSGKLDVVGVALNLDDNELRFYKNGSVLGSAAISITAASYGFAVSQTQSGNLVIANYGQDSSFAGYKTSGSDSATDDNGQGDFYDAPPSGFLAMCAANLPELTLSPDKIEQADDYFNTVLYDGANNATQSITVGFQPDWLWAKATSTSSDHYVFDVIRGANKSLSTNDAGVEDTTSGQFTQFTATGFDLPADNAGYINYTGRSYVAWNWRAGGDPGDVSGNFIKDGVAFTPTQGTINANSISANTTSGFSIVEFTSTVSSDVGETGTPPTIAHGLGVKPQWLIIKDRDGGSYPHWNLWHPSYQPDATYLNYQFFMELTSAANNAGWHRTDTGFTTNLFTPPRYQYTENGKSYIAYVFHEVEGFSRFNSYFGNNSTDGTFVYTGFKPAWLMIKNVGSSTNGWYIYDNKRLQFGTLVDGQLYANLQSGNDDGNRDLDFVSNGFKLRLTDSNVNSSGVQYIYMAFAEQPFKFTRAR